MNNVHVSLWKSSADEPAQQKSAAQPTTADVVVVGAGLSGITTAAQLARAGKRVVVLEMQPDVGAGDTGQTTAHITQLYDSGFATIVKNFGEEQARLVAQGLGAAIDTIEAWTQSCSIDCAFERLPAYVYAANEGDSKKVDEELDALKKAGIMAQASSDAGLPYATGEALRLERQAQFDPQAYLQGLASFIVQNGGVICTSVRYKSVTEHKDKVVVSTEAGDIEAGHVVLATHTPPNKLTLQLTLTPMMSYVLAVRLKDAFPRGLFYDTEEPYHYLRRHAVPGGELVIVGGADHRAGEPAQTESAYDELERWTRERLDVQEVAYRWSGMVFEPSDGLPYIGLNPGTQRTFVISGLSGTGMTAGTMGANICAAAIEGKALPYAHVFSPSRIKPVVAAAEMAKHSAAVGRHMVADRVKAFLQQEPLKAHQGKVLRHEGKSAAVYNDGETTHVLSPVCPHAGCYVQFNIAERTWDCPCHGSRFAATGRLMSGPAVSDLAPLEG